MSENISAATGPVVCSKSSLHAAVGSYWAESVDLHMPQLAAVFKA